MCQNIRSDKRILSSFSFNLMDSPIKVPSQAQLFVYLRKRFCLDSSRPKTLALLFCSDRSSRNANVCRLSVRQSVHPTIYLVCLFKRVFMQTRETQWMVHGAMLNQKQQELCLVCLKTKKIGNQVYFSYNFFLSSNRQDL